MKEELLKYLRSQRLMAIASVSSNKPWGASVYYTVDNKLNLYFVSQPQTRHMKELAKNRNVACIIADSSQKVTDKKVGIQVQGVVSEVKGPAKLRQILRMWSEANTGFQEVINYENIKKRVIQSKVYQVKPKTIKFFNEKLYGPEGERVLRL